MERDAPIRRSPTRTAAGRSPDDAAASGAAAGETPLDRAFAAMEADPGDEAARTRFHERVLDAEFFVLLEAEAEDALQPLVIDTGEGRFVLAFDRDERLADFLDTPAPYAALSGRQLVALLAGQGLGIALNPGVAPSETALGPEALDWLAAMTGDTPAVAARIRSVGPPAAATEALVAALDARIAGMAGRIEAAWLVGLVLEDGAARLGLGIAGARPVDEPALAAAVAEAARFSGGGAELDVTFLQPGPARDAFGRAGLRFDPPQPEAPAAPRPPGSDPDRPPRLR